MTVGLKELASETRREYERLGSAVALTYGFLD